MPIEFFYIVLLIQNSSYLTISGKKKYHSAQSLGFKELRDTVKGQRGKVAISRAQHQDPRSQWTIGCIRNSKAKLQSMPLSPVTVP